MNNADELKEVSAMTGLLPGTTVYLKAGTYTTTFAFNFKSSGQEGKPIKIRPYQNDAVIIAGAFQLFGDWVEIHELEIYDNRLGATDRVSEDPGVATPDDLDAGQGQGVTSLGINNKVINCIIHDRLHGAVSNIEPSGNGIEIYGCLVYNNGFINAVSPYGHGIYTASYGENPVFVKDNIVCNTFGYGLAISAHAPEISLDNVDNAIVEGNISFENGIWFSQYRGNSKSNASGETPLLNFKFIDNLTFHNGKTDYVLVTTGNEFSLYGDDEEYSINNAIITGNKLIAPSDQTCMKLGTLSGETITGNTIVGNLSGFTAEDYPDNTYGGTLNEVIVRPNIYKLGRANVAIYNALEANSIVVDLSDVSGLSVGDDVYFHNAQDFFNDIQTLTLDANKQVTVDMQAVNRSVVKPLGFDTEINACSFPAFGAFIVEKA